MVVPWPAMRLVTIPGFSLTPSSWREVAVRLGDGDVTNLSVPENGNFMDAVARLVAEGGPATYAGYSMGGRLALAAADEAPEAVEAVVLLSASPGIERDDERAARLRADEELAEWITDVGVDEFLDRWLSEPLFSGTDKEAARRHRIASTETIASQLLRLGQGAQPSLWDRLGEVEVPVLVMAGGNDKRYREIAERMAGAIGPNATPVIVPDAGHALLIEATDTVAHAITEFLTRNAG